MRRVLSLSLIFMVLVHPCLPLPVWASKTEEDLGRKFALVAQAQFPLVRDYTVQRYVQRLGQRIVARLEPPAFPYQFAVVQEPHLNAFSVPGGYIYLHSGLILQVNSDDELAGVLGHEIAHVQGHHFVRQQQDTKLLSYAGLASMVLALINPVLAAGASSAAAATQLKYQRQLEEEADYRGLQYLRQAGFDPHGMPRFLKKMLQEERLDVADIPPYFRSHPLSQERLSYIERNLGTFQWNRTAPEDTFALERVQAILRARQEPRAHVVRDYQQRVTQNSEDARALALLGTVLLQYNDWARAKQVLEHASAKGLRLDTELALASLRLGHRDHARQLLARQCEIDPEDADAHTQFCKLLWQEGNSTQAERECRIALQLDPGRDEALLTLAQLTERQGKRGEALLLLGQAMELQGRLEAALNQYQRAAQALGPNYAEAEPLAQKLTELEEIVNELRRQGVR